MRRVKAKQLRIGDTVINKGTIVKLGPDGAIVGVTYDDGSRTRYQQNARLCVQDLTDTVEEVEES